MISFNSRVVRICWFVLDQNLRMGIDLWTVTYFAVQSAFEMASFSGLYP